MVKSVSIIGAGIVGLATAFQLKKRKPDLKISIFEKESSPATHQTGHNSGVIHSGIYYKPGSLKATNCINGYNQLVRFCEEENIPHELCGKIIVATSQDELPQLKILYERGQVNGLNGLKELTREELKEYEPHVAGIAGIFVPQTGIVDYKEVAIKYADKLKSGGTEIYFNERIEGIQKKKEVIIQTDKQEVHSDMVINCAGLYSDKIARLNNPSLPLKIIPFRGEYYKIKPEKEYLVKNLIYPVPDPNFPFLGVHFTRMIKGGIEAGPNAVLAFKREGYTKSQIDIGELFETLAWPGFQKVALKYWQTGLGEMYRSFSKAAFAKALQKLIPEIQQDDLIDGGAGVRAQACDRTGGLLDDFNIVSEENIIHVCNAPSPAATSSLAIGETVASQAIELLN